jgi:hypothetical protein
VIAYGTGKAGRWAKGEAERRYRRAMVWLAGVACVGTFLAGAAVGSLLLPYLLHFLPSTRRAPLAAYWTVAGAALAATFAWSYVILRRVEEGPLETIVRERVRYLAGGQAEALVAYTLASLDDSWHLFNGIAMKGGGDVDHVLVGPGGLFALQTKASRGTYAVDDHGNLTLNGRPCDHADDAQRRAIQLRSWLEALLQADPTVKSVPWVQPVLVAPHAHRAFEARRWNAWVMDDRELFDHANEARRDLRPAEVAGCVNVLKRLTGWEAKPSPAATGT